MSRLIDRCYVAKSKYHGYGVFADEDINKDEIVCECLIPLQFVPKNLYMMSDYKFRHPINGEYNDDFIPLGHGAVVNANFSIDDNDRVVKSGNPNLQWESEDRIFRAIATMDIPKDTEILWDYGHDPFKAEEIS